MLASYLTTVRGKCYISISVKKLINPVTAGLKQLACIKCLFNFEARLKRVHVTTKTVQRELFTHVTKLPS